MNRRGRVVQYLGWGIALLGVILMLWGWRTQSTSAPVTTAATVTVTPTPTQTPTPEPIIPTARPSATPTTPTKVTATATSTVTSTASAAEPKPTSTATAQATTSLTVSPPSPTQTPAPVSSERWRVGISIPLRTPLDYDLDALGVGWVMNWHAYAAPPVPAGVEFAQMVRMKGGKLSLDAATITAIAAANPGATWLISNEPDVRWQDDVTPETYARLYHDAYHAIKAGDPGALVAAGGIAQPTPLRLAYLDRARAAYQTEFGAPLPVDAWQIHNYMLREERDSWGVDIPPGFTDDTGVLYTVDDSGNLDLFKRQIYDFRRWMAERGYRNQPLLVTEFGIPMPEDYGFPPERVQGYLRQTWTFFATATDGDLGHPGDGGRLVQHWCWFSMGYPPYPTGDIVNPETGAWTHLAETWMTLAGTK